MVDHVMPSHEHGHLLAVSSMLPARYADGSSQVGPRTQ